jgi:hypothetical protein
MEISGIGPVLAAGPITEALANSSELMQSLVFLGLPEDAAHYYAQGVRKGGTVVTLEVSRDAVQKAIENLNAHGPVDMKKRVAQWQEGGWKEFDPTAEPLREEQQWPREEYRQPDEKAETEEEKLLWPRGEIRAQREGTATAGSFKDYVPAFRKHFEASISEPGTTFDQYQPAYRYGYNLAVSERFKDYKE